MRRFNFNESNQIGKFQYLKRMPKMTKATDLMNSASDSRKLMEIHTKMRRNYKLEISIEYRSSFLDYF